MDRIATVTIKDIFKNIVDATFPRKLIIMKDKVGASLNLVLKVIKILNDNVYQNRLAEFDLAGSGDSGQSVSYADLTTLNQVGIDVKSVMRVLPYPSYQNFFTMFEKVFYNQPAILNAVRKQDDFLNFLMSKEVYNQIDRRFNSKDLDMFHVGDKILFGESYRNVNRVVIEYLPFFRITPNSATSEEKTLAVTLTEAFSYSKVLPFFPVQIQSITVDLGGGNRLVDNNGTGIFTPVGNTTGSINYNTGELNLKFGQTPFTGTMTITYTNNDYLWQFTEKEQKFVENVCEGLALRREGRAQSELNVVEMATNSDTLLEEGKDIIDKELENFKNMRVARVGRRF